MQSDSAGTAPSGPSGQPTQHPSREALSVELDQAENMLRQAAQKKLNGEDCQVSEIFRDLLGREIGLSGDAGLIERFTELNRSRMELVISTIPPYLLAPREPPRGLSRIDQGRLEFHRKFRALPMEVSLTRQELANEHQPVDGISTQVGASGTQKPVQSQTESNPFSSTNSGAVVPANNREKKRDCSPESLAQGDDKEHLPRRKQYDALNAQLATLQALVDQYAANSTNSNARLEDLQARVDQYETQLATLQARVSQYEIQETTWAEKREQLLGRIETITQNQITQNQNASELRSKYEAMGKEFATRLDQLAEENKALHEHIATLGGPSRELGSGTDTSASAPTADGGVTNKASQSTDHDPVEGICYSAFSNLRQAQFPAGGSETQAVHDPLAILTVDPPKKNRKKAKRDGDGDGDGDGDEEVVMER